MKKLKFWRCPRCKTVHSNEAIDVLGREKWSSSYAGINIGRVSLPYICPNCNQHNNKNLWKETELNHFEEDLFKI